MLFERLSGIFLTIFPEFRGPLFGDRTFGEAQMYAVLLKGFIIACCIYGIRGLVLHYCEKAANYFRKKQLGITDEDEVRSYPYLPYTLLRQLKHFMANNDAREVTVIGLDAERSNRKWVLARDHDRCSHMQVVGMTGSAKTTGVFLPLIFQDGAKQRPIIVIDAKGDMSFANDIRSVLALTGREDDFVMFSLTNKALSSTLNPLQAGECDDDVIIEAFLGNYKVTDEYYGSVSKTLFRHAYKILKSLGSPFTVMDVYAFLNDENCFQAVNKKALQSCPEALPHLKLLDVEVRRLNAQHKVWTSVLSGFNQYLCSFNDALFGDADADIVLTDCIRQKKVVYFQLPTNAYPEKARIVSRIVQSNIRYISALVQTGVLPRGTVISVIIDEFGSFASRNEDFIEVLNKARSAGLMITLGHQSMSDLSAVSEPFRKLIEENTLLKLILKNNDSRTCDDLAGSIGTRDKMELTHRKSIGEHGNVIYTGESSAKMTKEYILHPDRIKSLVMPGQAYLVNRINNVCKCVNLSYFTDLPSVPYKRYTKPDKRPGLELYNTYFK